MKTAVKVVILLFSGFLQSQNLTGAWESISGEEKTILVFTDKFWTQTTYGSKSGEFILTLGGSWNSKNEAIQIHFEFHSSDASKVGTTESLKVKMENNKLVFPETTYVRLNDGTPGKLSGAWLMSSRIVNGEKQDRSMENPRKTMKILSGTRFQWIAYDTASKQFLATGGGTYTTENGVYTENIEFFSRDQSRVGMHLKFDYDLAKRDWHHSGLSSKGDPINEIWSLRP